MTEIYQCPLLSTQWKHTENESAYNFSSICIMTGLLPLENVATS